MPQTWDIKQNMPDLTGKVVIVTGGNTGLGKETVRHLALRNAKVYMASRTESRALGAIRELKEDHPELEKGKGEIVFLQIDLTSLESCQAAARTFLEKEERLDILINNAGIMGSPYKITPDGVEAQFQTNHLGHFAFTIPLIPLLTKTSKDPTTSVRIVNVTSGGHSYANSDVRFNTIESVNRDSGPMKLYGQSKLANILFTKELSRRLAGERIFSLCVHPGVVDTELLRGLVDTYPILRFLTPLARLITITPYKGATTPLYAATAPEIEQEDMRGEYFVPMAKRADPSALAKDEGLARELWDLSEKTIKEKTGN